MLGSVGTLVENYDSMSDASRKEFLTEVYDEVEWLSALVENVLSLTRLEGQRVSIQKQPEAVEEIVAESLSRVSRRIGQRPVTVKTPEQLLMAPMDGKLIEQVLINLLDNAIKHTPDQTPIRIEVYADPNNAIFEVADKGPGLPPDAVPFPFHRVYTHKTSADDSKGTGLGLSICKSIVEAHGGSISAENDPSGGAIFRFTIPLEG